jgi:1-acyl-sn-glycerol-3-phosphate acyltransferase
MSQTQSSLSKVPVPPSVRSHISPWLVRLAYPLGCRVVLPLFFKKIVVKGREHIPPSEAMIVAPIHRSRWDALLVPYAVGRWVSGRDLRFMVMSSEMKGLQGWLIHHMGGFPVDIRHPAASSLEHSVELLKQGQTVVIFPEGGIFRDCPVHPLKRGLARIALEVKAQQPDSDLKILPISIQYSQIYPSWGSEVTVNIGKAIALDNYSTDRLKASSQKLTQHLEQVLKHLHEPAPDFEPALS